MKYLITKSASVILPKAVTESMAGMEIPKKDIHDYLTDWQLGRLLETEGALELLEHDEWLAKFRDQDQGRACFMVLHLKDTEAGRLRMFEPYYWLQEQGLKPEPELYEAVYAGPFACLPYTEKEVPRLLETVYAAFNGLQGRPDDYYGRSVSVSDIIVLKVAGRISCHYVDRIGFTRLDGFQMDGVR